MQECGRKRCRRSSIARSGDIATINSYPPHLPRCPGPRQLQNAAACYKALPSLFPGQNAKNPFPIVVKQGSTLDGRALLDYIRGAQSPIGCARRDGLRAAGGDACHRKDP
jgi:hypothetical protein